MKLDFWVFSAAFHRIVAAATFAVDVKQDLPSWRLTVGVGLAVLVLEVEELDGAVLVELCEGAPVEELVDDAAPDEVAAVPAAPPHPVRAIEAAITAAGTTGATTRRLRERDMSQLCPGGQPPAKSARAFPRGRTRARR